MGWIYTQFSVPSGIAGGELQLPYRIRVRRLVVGVGGSRCSPFRLTPPQSTLSPQSPQLTVVLKQNYFPALLWINSINHRYFTALQTDKISEIGEIKMSCQCVWGEIKMYHDGSIVLHYVVFPTFLRSIWNFIFRFSPNKHLAPIDKVWWCVLSTLCPVLRHHHSTCQ